MQPSSHPSVLRHGIRGVAFVCCAAWVTWGLVLPPLVLGGHVQLPETARVLLVVACVALTAAFSRVRFDFGRGERGIELSPDSAFIVLAAVLLPPPQAALVAAVGSTFVLGRYRGWKLLFHTANIAAAGGTASLIVHALLPSSITPMLVLPAALIAATVRSVTNITGAMAFEEAREIGAGVRLVRSTPLVAMLLLDIGLPVAAISLAGPYLERLPLLAIGVVTAAEGFTWIVMRLLHLQHHEREQNRHLRTTVSRFVPAAVAEQLLASGEDATLGGELREITVMFCDVRHFTTWAEAREPDEVIAELNGLLGELANAVISTGATLDKFTGDGLMAFWGAPDAQPDHAQRALQSVPRLLMRAKEFNLRREIEGDPPLDIGIGIHTGSAMVGNVGHADRLSYTAIGDTVNLAARLETNTRDFSCPVLISEATFLALPLEMQRQCARMDSIPIRGRRDRVRCYTLTWLARYRTEWWKSPPAA